ncbi:transmembrane emp24 domain-containing protein p24delta5 [Mercurialis annua]|uniref:transmembrane emp24 domain-containing protein p24delta5 n=1 Tax=Mercurialis annua TaxID=3986 RepID=UPI00215FB3BD|nr:transmembrane emp24 domain-containing protein p24delta5 [Mercurialis annua]
MAKKFNLPSLVTVASLIVLFSSLNLIQVAEAIWLTIPSSGTKCVSEEIHNNVVVLADFYVINDDHPENTPAVSAKVTSPYGNNLYHKENITHGQFAFTTSEAGNYLACFGLENHQQQAGTATLSLDWKIGIAAKDWDSVAKKDKIEGVELDLKRLEGVVEAIHNNLIYLREKEAEMREVSEKTNARVAWFSIMSLGLCIAASGLQLWHLKRYFQKKKLI